MLACSFFKLSDKQLNKQVECNFKAMNTQENGLNLCKGRCRLDN